MIEATEGVWAATRPLRESLFGELIWCRPRALRRDLILEAGSEQLAMLRWEKLFSLQASATCADGRWTIGRHGTLALREKVDVREPGNETPVATFDRHWRGTGVARFATGAEYRWERAGFWRSRWFWSSDRTERLVTYRSRLGLHRAFEMEVDPAAHRLAEIPVLVMLGGYLMAVLATRRRSH